MNTRVIAPALAVLLAVSGAACSSRHLVFSTSTKFGVDISATNGTASGLMFGYKRFEGASIPVDPERLDADGKPMMMSVLAVLDLRNGWFQGIDLFQLFATGKAAEQAADDPDKLAHLVGEAREAADESDDESDDAGDDA